MGVGTLAVLSLMPIAAVGIFLVILRWPASRAMPLSYLVAASLALWVWKVAPVQVAAATVNGLVVAVTLIYIVFGAILLLNTLQASGALTAIRRGLPASLPTDAFRSLSSRGCSGPLSRVRQGLGLPRQWRCLF